MNLQWTSILGSRGRGDEEKEEEGRNYLNDFSYVYKEGVEDIDVCGDGIGGFNGESRQTVDQAHDDCLHVDSYFELLI